MFGSKGLGKRMDTKNYQTKGDDRFWPPPEMKMGEEYNPIAGLEKAAVVGSGAQFVPRTKLARWT